MRICVDVNTEASLTHEIHAGMAAFLQTEQTDTDTSGSAGPTGSKTCSKCAHGTQISKLVRCQKHLYQRIYAEIG